tara:strand:+ start:1810 stop:1977 length:168 start_codon:yes stop_codon:yes gene_type:complete
MSVLHHESILESLYDEVVAESLANLKKEGFNVTESDLDMVSIDAIVGKRFEDLCL